MGVLVGGDVVGGAEGIEVVGENDTDGSIVGWPEGSLEGCADGCPDGRLLG